MSEEAVAVLDRARGVGEDGGWRTATRVSWVSAEIALASGDAHDALVHAQDGVNRCHRISARHRCKSEAILAACLAAGAGPDAPRERVAIADAHLRSAFRSADRGGWATLLWPLALIALDLRAAAAEHAPGHADHGQYLDLIAAGARATATIEAHLPADLAESWRSRPDVARLRSARER